MSFAGILGQALSPSWARMATVLLNGELPACTLVYTHSLWWLIPVLVCCLCCCSAVAQIANAVGSLRESRVSLVTELSLCRWHHV